MSWAGEGGAEAFKRSEEGNGPLEQPLTLVVTLLEEVFEIKERGAKERRI